MMIFIWFLMCMTAVGLLLLALGFFLKGRNRQAQDLVFQRLNVQDSGDLNPGRIQDQVSNPLLRAIQYRFLQAGLDASPSSIMLSIPVFLGLSFLLCLSIGWLAGLLIAAAVLLIGHLFLLQRSATRLKAITTQLPDFMDRLLRPLIAGNTLEEAFAIATRESPDPVHSLFMTVARQVRYGAPLEDALERVANVHELTDLHALAMASRVHRKYGGSIRQMVKSLIHMTRSRETAAQELRALTAETRLSAWLLVAIPVSITAFILVRNPEYYNAMWSSPAGRMILIAGFVLQFIGAVVIWRMMRTSAETV